MLLTSEQAPGFKSQFHAVGVYVRWLDQIVLLLRDVKKPQGSTWCIPGGKVNTDENTMQAALRELREETGITARSDDLTYGNTYLVRYAEHDFLYTTFELTLTEKPVIVYKNDEHSGYGLFTIEEALEKDLIEDEGACLRDHFGLRPAST